MSPVAELDQDVIKGLEARGARCVDASVKRVGDVDAGKCGGRSRLPHAVLSESAQLRERYRMLGNDPEGDPQVRELVERGVAPVAGGATGRGGMAFAHNLPAEGSYVMNPAEFAKWTERNDMPLEQRNLSGLGAAPIDQRISNVGIMSFLRITFKGTLVVGGTGAVTATYQWPWNVIKRFNLNINGQTSILSCEGTDLRARRQRIFRNPREQVSSAPATDTSTADPVPGVIANGTYAVVLVYEIPVAHDIFTLVGSIYAQSDQTYLNYRITPAMQAELFSVAAGGTVALTGTFHTMLTFYDIPVASGPKGQTILLPDLRWLHGYFSSDQPYAATGELNLPMIRTAGQLISYAVFLDNGGVAQIDPLALSAARFQYGGNRRPRTYEPVEQLIEKNIQDYNGRIKPGYLLLDFEADNPERDLVYPKGVTELATVLTIPAGTTINANARAHFVEETLFSGR